MKKILFILFLGFAVTVNGQSKGITFLNDTILEQVLLQAKAENKLIFIDCYAVWCGPCKFMDKNIFPDEEVGNYHNTNFINLKYDMEKPYGIKVKEKYQVKGYPTYLYLDANGEVVHRGIGSTVDVASFLELSKTAMNGDKNFKAINEKIRKGDRTAETINQYLNLNYRAANTDQLLNDHFNLISEDDRYSEHTWDLFKEHLNNIESAPFQFLITNRAKYERLYGKKAIETMLYNSFSLVFRSNPEKYESLKEIDAAVFAKNKREMTYRTAYSKFMKEKTNQTLWKDYITTADEMLKYNDVPATQINSIAWNVYENYTLFKDKAALRNAEQWMKMAIIAEPENSAFNDTYAHILFELGNKKAAIAAQTKAIEQAKKSGSQDLAELETNLKKFTGK